MELSGLTALRNGLAAAAEGAVADVCERIRAESVGLCPVRTGNLRDGIGASVETDGANAAGAVSAKAPYAAKVELGSYAQAPKPFLSPAFSLHAPALADALAQRLGGLL